MLRGGGRSALLALCLAVAGLAVVSGQGLGCSAGDFVKGVANISNLQTSSQLLATNLPYIGTPNDSAVFLPTDAAWTAFRSANGANAPDVNRSIAILLYNSIITYGQASEATLIARSPIQTSAADLVAAYLKFVKGQANAEAALPLSFATVNGVTVATDVGNHTASFNGSYTFCNQRVYATNGVLLPSATYAQVPETYLADIAALTALSAPVASPPPPARVPPPASTPTPSPTAAPTTSVPSSSANTPTSAPTASPAAAPAPAPAPSASLPAAAFAVTAGGGILAAAVMLFALV